MVSIIQKSTKKQDQAFFDEVANMLAKSNGESVAQNIQAEIFDMSAKSKKKAPE